MLSVSVQEAIRKDLAPYVFQFFKQMGAEDQFDMDRISVWADVDKFNWKEDAFVWGQKRGYQKDVFSIYFDAKQVSYARMDMTEQEMVKEFWKGFLQKYGLPDSDPNKIWINKDIYEEKRKEKERLEKERKESIIKSVESKEVKSETDALAKEIALDAIRESHTTK